MDRVVSERALVSVIVPTYNRPELLKRALSSISEQEYRRFEAVVVNDAGQDVSAVVAEYPFARLLTHRSNRGLAAARNTGIMNADGEYIAYLDDDDILYTNHIGVLVAVLLSGVRAAYSDAEVSYNPVQEPRLYMSNDFDRGDLLRNNLFPVCCVMHERSLIDEAGGFDESLPTHEDWDLWIRMSAVTDFVHIAEPTCLVDHTRQRMSNDGHNMRRGIEMVLEKHN